MTRRVLDHPLGDEARGQGRMAPGGRMWSERPMHRAAVRRLPLLGEAPLPVPPTGAHWYAHELYQSLDQPATPGTLVLDYPEPTFDTAERVGEIVEFIIWSARGYQFTPNANWAVLDSAYLDLGTEDIGAYHGKTADWQWGIAMASRPTGSLPSYAWNYTATPNCVYWDLHTSHIMFRNQVGGTWEARRSTSAVNSPTVTFEAFPSDMQLRFHAGMARSLYSNWQGGSPTSVSGVVNLLGAVATDYSPTRPYTGTSNAAWDTEAQTKTRWIDAPPVTGSYTAGTWSGYGKQAWQMAFIGWTP